MASPATGLEPSNADLQQPDNGERFIRVILADTQAIFRAGLRKIFALEDEIRVVAQAETLAQSVSAAKKFSADIMIFESALAPNPIEALSELLRQSSSLKLVVVTPDANREMTLEMLRRGAFSIVSREIEPEKLVDCLRSVALGEPWLDVQGTKWVLEAYRTQSHKGANGRSKVALTPKEALIVSCVTQGMKNKEIAVRVGTTEQVVKNYLRKVYDKLGVADRLELALYCLNNRVIDNAAKPVDQQQANQPASVVKPAEATMAAAAGSGSSLVSGAMMSAYSPKAD